MALEYNGKSVTFKSFRSWTNNFEDLSCLSLDMSKINTKGSYGPTIPIVFKDANGKFQNGFSIVSLFEKHCGSVHNLKFNSYNFNIQKIHTPTGIIDRETNQIIREAKPEDISPMFVLVEKVKAHIQKLITAELEKGTIRAVSKKKDDGKGLLYVKVVDFVDTPFQYYTKKSNGSMEEMTNPIMRITINSHNKPIFNTNQFIDLSEDDLKSDDKVPLTVDNIEELIPKLTKIKLNYKFAQVRNSDKGFSVGSYLDGVGIKRQVSNNTYADLSKDDEDESDNFGKITLEDS
jgi:hypothetical protein